MAIDLFSFVGMFDKQLATAAHLLDKGIAHVTASGGDPEAMLDWRLIDDMAPLRFQLAVVNNFAQGWPARAAGLPVPPEAPLDADIAGLRAINKAARAFLASLTREQFAGRDETPIAYSLGNGMEPTLPAGQWVSGFGATNLYFHLSIAYAILRARGVPIGKPDLFAGGL